MVHTLKAYSNIYGMCMQLRNCGVEISPLGGKHLASVAPRDWLTNTYQISLNPPQRSSSDELKLEFKNPMIV